MSSNSLRPLAVVWSVFLLALLACGSSSSPKSAAPTDAGGDTGSGEAAAMPQIPNLPNTDAGAVAGLPSETWTWVPVDQAICRDGSPTGIAISANPNSDKLMIFLAGGGACFNSITCSMNPANFAGPNDAGATDSFSTFAATAGSQGLFDRSQASNPVKDWNFVYVPYCTGDIFAGNVRNATVTGVNGMQQFVGYANMHLFLQRIVPTFPNVKQVLLTGVSAGGFGASVNLYQTAKAFGSVPVSMLDDSGPSFDPPDVESCLLDETRQLWGMDNTILVECGSDCPDKSAYPLAYAHFLRKTFPGTPFGLVDTVDDSVITFFFGFGANNCMGLTALTQQQYTMGLDDFRAAFKSDTKMGSFIYGDSASCNCSCPCVSQHTSIGTSSILYSVNASDGTKLVDWVTRFVAGTVTNVGP